MRILGSVLASLAILGACKSSNDVSANNVGVDSTAGRVAALGGKLTAPQGLKVSYYAQQVGGVRFMTIGPDGAVYASQPELGRIIRLPDDNHDGIADVYRTTGSGWGYAGNYSEYTHGLVRDAQRRPRTGVRGHRQRRVH